MINNYFISKYSFKQRNRSIRSIRFNCNENKKKEKLVVLGSGWSSFRFIQSLDHSKYDVNVVSSRNHFLFTPLLASTCVGTLDFRSIVEPIRVKSKGIHFYQASCQDIDFENKKIICDENKEHHNLRFEMDYDKLVIGIGANNNTFNIPGVTQHAYFLKELSDARKLRTKIIEIFERAALPNRPDAELREMLHFVIVGGGPTGVEFAAELADFFWEDVQRYFPEIPVYKVRITLLEAGNTILNAFDKQLVRRSIKNITRQGIDIRTNSIVKKVEDGKVILQDGEEIKYGLLLWCTGVGPRPLTQKLKIPKTQQGRIIVDDHLRVKGVNDVYAFGDCAEIEDNPLPATAQVAQQQGIYLAKSLCKKEDKPFNFHFMGLMTYTGRSRSVMDSKYFKGTGILAWIMWRSVYLTRLGSLKNKIQVPFEWLRTFVLGRDVTNFD